MTQTSQSISTPTVRLSRYPRFQEKEPPLSDDWRFPHLSADIRDRISATGGDPGQYTMTDQGTDTGTVEVTETWTVNIRSESGITAGNKTGGTVEASSDAGMSRLAQNFADQLLDGKAAEILLDRLAQQKKGVLTPASHINDLVTEAFSHCHECKNCWGNGRVTCTTCHGLGTITETVYETVNGQQQPRRASRICSNCSGGWRACGTCNRTGLLTDWIQVEAYATPAYSHCGSEETSARCQALLTKTDTNTVIRAFPCFTDGLPEASGPATVIRRFSGKATVTFMAVTSPRQSCWTVWGVGPTAQYLNPPPILDELLKDGIRQFSKVGHFRQRERLKVLDNVRKVPLLEEMLRQNANASKVPPAETFSAVAHDLVSPPVAKGAGNAIDNLQKGVCPRYAADLWTLIGLYMVTALFIVGNHSGLFPNDGIWFLSGLAAYVAGGIICCALTLYRRSSVPQEYRGPMQEWKPALLVLGLVIALGTLSTVASKQMKAITAPAAELLSQFTPDDVKIFDGLLPPKPPISPLMPAPAPALTPPARSPAATRAPGPVSSTARPAVLSGSATLIDTATVQIEGIRVPLSGLDAVLHPVTEAGLRQYLSVVGPLRCTPAGAGYTCQTETGADFAEVIVMAGYAKVQKGARRNLSAAEAEARKARAGVWGLSPQ